MKLLFLIITLLGICFSGTTEVKKKPGHTKKEITSFEMTPGLLFQS